MATSNVDFQAEVKTWRQRHFDNVPDIIPVNELLSPHQSAHLLSTDAISNVLVCARLRPLLQHGEEIGRPVKSLARASSCVPIKEYEAISCCSSGSDAGDNTVEAITKTTVFVHQEQTCMGQLTGGVDTSAYCLHRVFPSHASTSDLFQEAISPALRRALKESPPGDSPPAPAPALWCISFGMTGSGKTHTSQECFVLAAQNLLLEAQARGSQLTVSMAEIRGNDCYDLLDCPANCSDGPGRRLSLREDGTGRVQLPASQWRLCTGSDVAECLDVFRARRATAATPLNHSSSRSHAVISLFLASQSARPDDSCGEDSTKPSAEQSQRAGATTVDGDSCFCKHTLERCWASAEAVCRILDLAGSERQRDVSAPCSPERLAEMKSINYSLGCLKECIRCKVLNQQVVKSRPVRVPYRNCKLTLMMKEVFEEGGEGGGAARNLFFLAHLSPFRSALAHSLQTLDFATSLVSVSRAEREATSCVRLGGPEAWSAHRVQRFVREFEAGRLAHLADVFCVTGRVLSTEWVGHVERRVLAAGGTEQDAHGIYEAFHDAKAAHAALAKRQEGDSSAGVAGTQGPMVAARARAAAKKKFASQLKQCEDTVFCLETPDLKRV